MIRPMQQYQTFVFERYAFDPKTGVIELHYGLDDSVAFVETLRLPLKGMHLKDVDPELLDRALFLLHIIGGISYYKTSCPRKLDIRSGSLSPSQASFFTTVYLHGLGQFFYENAIDFRDLIAFPAGRTDEPEPIAWSPSRRKVLTPVGGGKDSAVTAELLRRAKVSFDLLRIGAHPLIERFATVAKADLLTVDRVLSPALTTLNAEGAYNGHIPITAYNSILSAVLCLIYGYKAAVFSNERSADYGSLLYYGMEVNHQWSKGLAFERALQELLQKTLASELAVFSMLRPLSELHITQIFATCPEYFPVVTSCNANWRLLEKERSKERWCARCPKCAFVFAMMAAFLPRETVLEMFGGNFFEEEALVPFYRQLLGMEGFKPFECVGTPEETQAAFLLIRERGEFNDSLVMRLFMEQQLPYIDDAEKVKVDALTPSPDHAIPAEFSTVLADV